MSERLQSTNVHDRIKDIKGQIISEALLVPFTGGFLYLVHELSGADYRTTAVSIFAGIFGIAIGVSAMGSIGDLKDAKRQLAGQKKKPTSF